MASRFPGLFERGFWGVFWFLSTIIVTCLFVYGYSYPSHSDPSSIFKFCDGAAQTCQSRGARLGPSGAEVVLQQWLVPTPAPGVQPQDRRRLDLIVYGATTRGGALCCDATLVSPLTRTGHPQPRAVQIDGAALQVAERRKQAAYPELTRGGLLTSADTAGAGVCNRRSMEHRGPALRP